MKKNKWSYVYRVLLAGIILMNYTDCRCNGGSPQDNDGSSSSSDSSQAQPAAEPITDAMIQEVENDVTKEGNLQFLVDCLKKLKGGDRSDIDSTHAAGGGRTALHYATKYGYPDVVKALLQMRANSTELDNGGEPPLLDAFKVMPGFNDKREEIVKIFLDDPNFAAIINQAFSAKKNPLDILDDNIRAISKKDKLKARSDQDTKSLITLFKIKLDMKAKGAKYA